jgi:hypothetical protein
MSKRNMAQEFARGKRKAARGEAETKKFMWQGHEETVTRYSDGSSTRHGGGPCGDVHYDDLGREC